MQENITVEPLLSIADNDNELRRGGWASRVEPPIEAFGKRRRLESSLQTGCDPP